MTALAEPLTPAECWCCAPSSLLHPLINQGETNGASAELAYDKRIHQWRRSMMHLLLAVVMALHDIMCTTGLD